MLFAACGFGCCVGLSGGGGRASGDGCVLRVFRGRSRIQKAVSLGLIGTRRDSRVWELIEAYKRESGKKKGGGFPDVVAYWPDQTVSLCEVKVRGKDRLNQNQIQGDPSHEVDPGHTNGSTGLRVGWHLNSCPTPAAGA